MCEGKGVGWSGSGRSEGVRGAEVFMRRQGRGLRVGVCWVLMDMARVDR